jgi:phage head maturation protease
VISIRGFCCVYDQVSSGPANSDGTRGIIAKHALSGMVGQPCTLQIGHDPAPAIASVEAGTLELFDCEYGLGFLAVLDTTGDNEWLSRLKVFGCSLGGFNSAKMTTLETKGQTIRQIDKSLFDHIGLVTLPAYQNATCWNAEIQTWDVKLQTTMAIWQRAYHAAHQQQEAEPNIDGAERRRAAAAAFRLGDAKTLRMYGDVNPHTVRLAPTDVPAPTEKRRSSISMLAEVTEKLTHRLIALERKVAGQPDDNEPSTMDMLMQALDEAVDRLLLAEQRLDKLEADNNGG